MKIIYKNKFKAIAAAVLFGSFGLSACNDFLDINQNPNNPDTAAPSLLLPTVEAAVGQIVGNGFQINGSLWSQYWTQSPSASQYQTIEQYNQASTAFDVNWLNIYRRSLINAQLIIDDRSGTTNQYIQGIATILKAYTFQLATDAFGDIPLSQALKSDEYISPEYDSQELVYDSIFTYIDQGIALMKTETAASPGDQDMVFQGNPDKWIAFANTLKLRAYLRLSEVDAQKASSGIAALYASNPTFLTEDASIEYSTVGGNQNPLYNEMVGLGSTQNLVASQTVVKAFKDNNDPRVAQLYNLLPTDTARKTSEAIPQGSYRAYQGTQVSTPSAITGALPSDAAAATTPVKLISLSESKFLQAEAVARGWAPGGNAESLYKEGITASFTYLGLTTGDAEDYIAQAAIKLPGDLAGKIKAIIEQKYYAMCGIQGFEAWTEFRRTGYPDFIKPSAASLLGAGQLPLRFLYPNSEITTNGNYPGTVRVNVPVWWDVNN